MPSTLTVEQRLAAVENAVCALQQAMADRAAASFWLQSVIGSMKDEPDFDEVLTYGRAIRHSDRPVEDGV